MTKLIAATSLALLSSPSLVSLFNDAVDAFSLTVKPVAKFSTRGAGQTRVEKLMETFSLHLAQRDDGSFFLINDAGYNSMKEGGAQEEEITADQAKTAGDAVVSETLENHVAANLEKQKKVKAQKEPSEGGKRGRTPKWTGMVLNLGEDPSAVPKLSKGSDRMKIYSLVAANPGIKAEDVAAIDASALYHVLRLKKVVASLPGEYVEETAEEIADNSDDVTTATDEVAEEQVEESSAEGESSEVAE